MAQESVKWSINRSQQEKITGMSYQKLRPIFFALDPETAHGLALSLLKLLHGFNWTKLLVSPPVHDPVTVMGLNFSNRIGLAAGLDKNADYVDCLAALGFGFLEVGTVTPRPQPGNPRPRLFRLPDADAIINRMGFNNHGVDHLIERVGRRFYQGVLGINIGKNFDTPIEQAVDDYLIGLRKVYAQASYVAINISSPNTKNLRQLQQSDEMKPLLDKLKQEQTKLAAEHGKYVPLVVKIAPDLSDQAVESAARIFLQFGIDGVIATNTTIARQKVAHLPNSDESGGLSGAPLLERSTQVVQVLHSVVGSKVPIIAAGGITSDKDAKEKIAAGASLVQVYTGLIYRGPQLIQEVARALVDAQI